MPELSKEVIGAMEDFVVSAVRSVLELAERYKDAVMMGMEIRIELLCAPSEYHYFEIHAQTSYVWNTETQVWTAEFTLGKNRVIKTKQRVITTARAEQEKARPLIDANLLAVTAVRNGCPRTKIEAEYTCGRDSIRVIGVEALIPLKQYQELVARAEAAGAKPGD